MRSRAQFPRQCRGDGAGIRDDMEPTRGTRSQSVIPDPVRSSPALTAACESVARREGVGPESVRRWVRQAQVDSGQRQGVSSQELAEIKELKAKVRRLEEDNEILRRASIFF